MYYFSGYLRDSDLRQYFKFENLQDFAEFECTNNLEDWELCGEPNYNHVNDYQLLTKNEICSGTFKLNGKSK